MSALPPESPKPYADYSSWLRQAFGGRVQKISVDLGFGCPNRDGTLGTGGCSFCRMDSFVPAYCDPGHGVSEQLMAGMRFFARKYPDQGYLAYFQAGSGTYADAARLEACLTEAAAVPGVRGVVVGTRPDTVPQAVVEVLARASRNTWLTVELGVESTKDATLARVGRGHGFDAVRDACARLGGAGIRLGAHIILGLPGEGPADFASHARRLSELPFQTLKIHHLQVLQGTRLAEDWKAHPGDFRLFSVEDYLTIVQDFLERLRPDIAIERFCNESPPDIVLAPRWDGVKNFSFAALLERRMRESGARQGRLFSP